MSVRQHPEAVIAAFEAWASALNVHENCVWKQVGRCVYCADHDVRLYQGEPPKERKQPGA